MADKANFFEECVSNDFSARSLWCLIIFIYLAIVFSPYKNVLKNADEKINISYATGIKKWFCDKP